MSIVTSKHSVLLAAVLAAAVLSLPVAPRRAAAEWPQCGQAIVTASLSQVHSAIASDDAGGAIVAWQDGRLPRINIFAMRVLDSGELHPAWPTDGQALLTDPIAMASADGGQTHPVLVPDGAGGAIVSWQDLRSPVTEFDLFAQHVQSSGVVDPAWPANGTVLVSLPGAQESQVMVSDGSGGRSSPGGAIVAWMDSRPGSSVFDLYAQHVLGTGVVDPAWPVNGIAVSTAAGAQQFPAIVSDGAGGVIITWDDLRDATSGDDIYALRILNSGVVAPGWPVNGRALCTAPGDQGRPTIVSDGAHGAVVAWADSRAVGTSHIFAQHVLGSGSVDPAWPVNGRAISGSGNSEARPLAVSDGAGGAVVSWQSFTLHVNQFAQHVTAAGIVDPAWPAGGRALSHADRNQIFADVASDGAGGAIVAWQDTTNILSQHVLASGTLDPAFPDGGLPLCNLPDVEGDVAIVATAGGGAIASWSDTRNGKDLDIYAMQVLVAATADVPPGPANREVAFAPPRPNPARAGITLRFTLPRETEVRLAIYDVTGRRVRTLASGERPAGEQAVGWDLRDESGRSVGAGLYFARLEAEGRSFTRRLTALD